MSVHYDPNPNLEDRSATQDGQVNLWFPVFASVCRTEMPSSFFTVEAEEPNRTTTQTSPDEHELVLDEAPIQSGRLHEFSARGRTLKHSFHPILSQGQAWIGEKHVNTRMQSSFIVRDSLISLMPLLGSKYVSSS